MKPFKDRDEAGKVLASSLKEFDHKPNTIVLGLPRGGIPVACQIARTLSLPLDVFVVRKLGLPGHEEYAMGAIAPGGIVLYNRDVMNELNVEQKDIELVLKKEQEELARREHLYRGTRLAPELIRKTIILVDDGIATGFTMRAAIDALRQKDPASIIVAVPVASYTTCQEMKHYADEIICPLQPVQFHAVGLWYQDFSQTSDEEVIELLEKSSHIPQ